MGIAENIDALMAEYDITAETVARIAKVTPGAVSGWRKKGARPRDEAVQNLCEYFRLSPDDILSDHYGLAAKLHGRFGMPVYSGGEATVPLMSMGRVHAGPWADEEATSERVDVPAPVMRSHPHARAIIVEGDCMNRVVPEGMAAVLDPDLTPANGSIVVAELDDHRAVMRRWYRGGETLTLVPDSYSDHEVIVVRWEDGPVKVLGVVVWVQSAREMM